MEISNTVRSTAHRLNVSISEIRRRRQGYPARKNHGPCMCPAHIKERWEQAKREKEEAL